MVEYKNELISSLNEKDEIMYAVSCVLRELHKAGYISKEELEQALWLIPETVK